MKKKLNKGKAIIEKQTNTEDVEISKAIKILIGVICCFALVYFVAGLLTGEIKLGKQTEMTEIQYTEILAERTFKQKESEYFVMFYSFDSDKIDMLEAIFGQIQQNAAAYKVDLDKKFNSDYVIDDAGQINTSPTNLEEMKILDPTLIKIKDGKVTELITGFSQIKEYSLKLS